MNLLLKSLEGDPKSGKKDAFQFLDEAEVLHSVSRDEFFRDSRRARAWLREKGISKGDRVALLAGNLYEYFPMVLGIWASGATALLLNPYNTPDEICYQIDLIAPKLLLTDSFFEEGNPGVLASYEKIKWNLTEFTSAAPLEEEPEDVEEESLSTILFTSGTTGHSKGVMLSYRNLRAGISATGKFLREQVLDCQEELNYASYPFFHIAGLTTTLAWFMTEFPMVICLNKRYFFRDLQAFRFTHISVVPAEMETIAKYLRRGKMDCLGSCRKIGVGAAKIGSEVVRFFQEQGIRILSIYGLSENTGLTFAACLTPDKAGSVGKPDFGTEVKLIDGEICLQGDAVMMGYYENPEATEEVLQDGWLYTGDLGRVDEDGFYYITGRKKNLIILGSGENVSPEELENLLLQDPRVAECVVKEDGGKICAEIYSQESAEALQEILDKVNKTLPHFKRMTVLQKREEPFPRTANGKIKRKG